MSAAGIYLAVVFACGVVMLVIGVALNGNASDVLVTALFALGGGMIGGSSTSAVIDWMRRRGTW